MQFIKSILNEFLSTNKKFACYQHPAYCKSSRSMNNETVQNIKKIAAYQRTLLSSIGPSINYVDKLLRFLTPSQFVDTFMSKAFGVKWSFD